MLKKYRKKPLIIEAQQMHEPFTVETLEGTMHGAPGDYLVIGVKGEKYIVKQDIFKDLYDEVL